MFKWIKKYFWELPYKYFRALGVTYLFGLFCVLAKLVIDSSLAPEWLSRLVFSCLLLMVPIPYVLWKCFCPNSSLVGKGLLAPGREKEKMIMGFCARLIFSGITAALIWSAVQIGQDIGDLVKYGDKCLIRKRAKIRDVHELGITGPIYRIIYLVGEADARDEYLSMSWGRGLWENTTWDFVMLKNSGTILEIHKTLGN